MKVDPSFLQPQDVGSWLRAGIAAAKAGQRERARTLLMRVVEQDEENVSAWLWLSGVVDSLDDREVCLENVLTLDPDNDAATNQTEFGQGTNPLDPDTDVDDLPDGWEITWGLDPNSDVTPNGRNDDPDSDGRTNYEEYLRGTDPFNPDIGGDGIPDGDEVGKLPTDPVEGGSGDGITIVSQDETGMVLALKTSEFDSTRSMSTVLSTSGFRSPRTPTGSPIRPDRPSFPSRATGSTSPRG